MIRLNRTATLQLLLLALLLLFPKSGAGQSDPSRPVLGLTFDASESTLPDRDQLAQLQAMGFRHLELATPLDEEFTDRVIDTEFLLMVQQTRRFVTSFDLQKNDSLYLAEDLTEIRSLQQRAFGRLIAYSPFLWPYDRSEEARSLLSNFALQLRSQLADEELRIYYSTLSNNENSFTNGWDLQSTTHNASDIPAQSNTSLIRLLPGSDDTGTLRHLYQLLEPDQPSPPSLILIPWDWLNRMIENHPWLATTLTTYYEEDQLVTPYPHTPEEPAAFGLEKLWILLIAVIYLLLYRYSSFVKESGWRYFSSHSYYKEQILPFRLRSAGPGLFFQVQLLLMSLVLWTLFYHSLPIQGQLLLQEWVVLAGADRNEFWIPFHWVGLFATLHTTFLLWVWAFNSRYNLKEVLALYGWPLQTLLFPTILLLVLYWNGVDGRWIGAGTATWILLWTVINYITALDILRSLEKRRILYGLAITIHLGLTLFLFLALFFYPPLQEPLQTLWFLL